MAADRKTDFACAGRADVLPRVYAALAGLGRPYQRLLEFKGERQLFLVGGTIRDIILGRAPVDFDFAVSGSGIEFAKSFARKIRGKFVLLSEPEDQGRVVYRKKVTLDFNGFGVQTIEEDLRRRDFTVNAIAIEVRNADCPSTDRAGGVRNAEPIDPFGGGRAIADRRLIPVSDKSLELDPLRLLRAFRFALELGFAVDRQVLEQAKGISLERVAPERIGYELMRIMDCDGSFKYIARLNELGFLRQIFPEASTLFEYQEIMQHSLGTYAKLEELIHRPSFFSRFEPESRAYFGTPCGKAFPPGPRRCPLLKLAGLFHDIAKPETEFTDEKDEIHFYRHDILGARRVEIMARRRLRLSRNDLKVLKKLVEYHMRLHLLATGPELTDRAIRRFFRDLNDEYFGLMLLTFADGYATAGFTRHLEEKFTRIIALKREFDAAVKVKRLVTGDDLIALGLKPGPIFKTILAELEELQIEGKITSKEAGLECVKKGMATGHPESPD
jgi:tRNA nucleotidyltransferase/poly(A) polymerase